MSASPAAPGARAAGSVSIRVLPAEVAGRIAAGEVVERPVSVVRELLDNAIDAGATRITVEVEEGGVALIRVTDDGRGIPPEQVELAFERHATSKISAMADLQHVHTLGFRGEALPSIAAAGDVEITTRSAAEPVGVQLFLVDGRPIRRAGRAAPHGTAFTVRNLFGRLPARRKFLSGAAAESRAVTVLVSHYALAYPGIAFALSSNGRAALRTPGDGLLRHAFASIYGPETGRAMLDVDHEEEGIRVAGLAGPPSVHRGNRSAISIFINGRWVQSRALTFAAVDAYQSQLPMGRHPVAALSVRLADEEVDVNVHPAKAEVRFRDGAGVARAVRHAVGKALEGSAVVSWLPRPAAGGEGLLPAGEAPAPGGSLRERLEPQPLRGPQPTQPGLGMTPGAAVATPGTPTPLRDVLPMLRVVGQMASTYVVAEGPDGMYLIDQHAAHERVVYDRLVARPKEDPVRQPLLDPVLLELDPVAAATVEEHFAHLSALGLGLEPFGENTWLVREIPPGLADTDIAARLRSLLEKLAGDRRITDPFGRAAATVACHSSVRAGMGMAMEEMRKLVEELERTASPRTCPHGRPTLVHVGTELIERQFGRR
jgi:DNA mismatch repair protein MutL